MSDAQSSERFVVDDVSDDVKAAITEIAAAPEQVEQKSEPEAKPEPKAEEKPAEAGERLRGADGKFVAKDKTEQPEQKPVEVQQRPIEEQKPAEAKPQEQQTEQKPDAVVAAPASYSVAAKLAFDKADPQLKAAIAKRETEINQGFAELKDYRDLKPFRERAQRAGQSLGQALEAYTGIEELFRRNPEQGFLHVADNLRQVMPPQQIGQMLLAAAQKFGAVPQPNQNGNGHQNADAENPLLPIIQPIIQRLASLEGTFNQRQAAEQANAARAAETVVERFRSDPQYRFFSNLEDQIVQLISSGIVQRTGDHAADLAKAYDLACNMHPEIREQLINERIAKTAGDKRQADQAIADKAKAASKSLNGSSAPGTVIEQKTDGADDLEADVRAAYRQHAA
jgi:hypothetical protein